MRITQRSMQFVVEANLQGALGRLQRIQEQMSSGKQINRPSDSPTGTVSALRFRADIRRSEQLQRNADDAQGWLDTTDRALTSQVDIVNRARTLLLQGINDSMSDRDRAAIAVEVEQLRQAAFATANTTYLGRPIFAGTATATTAYDPASGAYNGDNGTVDRVVAPNVSVQANVIGTDVFGPPGADLFTVLGDIADHLRNDPTQLDADITAIDGAFDRLVNTLSSVGARANQVTGMKQRLEDSVLAATNGLAEVESIDLPATIVKLQLQEVAYQAALNATSRVIQPSLVDFLR
jgi:flagellar hook-associated protein 3 FlgL